MGAVKVTAVDVGKDSQATELQIEVVEPARMITSNVKVLYALSGRVPVTVIVYVPVATDESVAIIKLSPLGSFEKIELGLLIDDSSKLYAN